MEAGLKRRDLVHADGPVLALDMEAERSAGDIVAVTRA